MPGDSVEYEVTVKNDGNIDATLRTIATNATNTNEDIRFTHTIKQGEVLKKESETKFTFKIVFDERATTLPINSDPIEVTMKLDYLQNTGNSLYVPTNITTDNTCFSYNASGVITKYDYSCGNEVSIPESIDGVNIKSIANNAFVASDNTKPLQSINMENASYLTTFSFSDFINLKYATLPKTLVEIPQMAFFNCPLTTINLPGTVEKIGNYAFKGTSLSGSLYLPNSLKTIGVGAFASLKLTGTLTIPDSVTAIGGNVFSRCSSLKKIKCLATTAPSIVNTTFQDIKQNGILKVPAGSDYSSWMNTGDFYLGKYNWYIVTGDDLIIMTSESNPEVMKVCYNQGWAESPYEMYASEAAIVTSIGRAFERLGSGNSDGYGYNEYSSGYDSPSTSFNFSFDEFKVFNIFLLLRY